MTQAETGRRSVRIIRWIARVWSLVLVATVALFLLLPNPNPPEPMPAEDWFLVSLPAIALLGLLVAWRWELAGGILTIVAMFARELAWVLIKSNWFAGFLHLWAGVVPPAILFLIARRLERRDAMRRP